MNVEAIHADFVVAGSHKWMMAPEGTAVFWSRPEARAELQVRQYGWHMLEHALDFEREDWQIALSARRFEAGTMNTLGMMGLNASLSLLEETGLPNVTTAVLSKAGYLMDGLREIPRVRLVSDPRPGRRSGIVTFQIAGMSPEAIHRVLKQAGVFCARRYGGVRLSPHFYTPDAHLGATLAAVRRCVEAP
jgi:selenocysteine lyase/cysteine desulfurase